MKASNEMAMRGVLSGRRTLWSLDKHNPSSSGRRTPTHCTSGAPQDDAGRVLISAWLAQEAEGEGRESVDGRSELQTLCGPGLRGLGPEEDEPGPWGDRYANEKPASR